MTAIKSDTSPEPYRQDASLSVLQQSFLDLKLCMFLHFNMATYQDLEWGDDTQPDSAFNPTKLDTDQWADAAVDAGMKGAFLTTKHHDGFCLWPTKTGTDSVLNTPLQLDIVDHYAKSFRKRGLKVGLYYSILDKRNDIRHFNVTPSKIQLVKDHLTELLTNYGEINMIIFDGWDAPWSRVTYTEFPFDDIYRHIKSLQPNCLVSDLNAQSFSKAGLFYGDIKAYEQNAGEYLPSESVLPAFSCVTLTDGWFWKLADSHKPLKSTKQVVEEWLIPQNERHCTLVVNAPPNRDGVLEQNLIDALHSIGKAWTNSGSAPTLQGQWEPVTTNNLVQGCAIRALKSADGSGPDLANDGQLEHTWFTPSGDKDAYLEVEFPQLTAYNTLVIVEPIGRWGDYPRSRIGEFFWECDDGQTGWIVLAHGKDHPDAVTTFKIPRTVSKKLRLRFEVIRDTAHINEIFALDEPERVTVAS